MVTCGFLFFMIVLSALPFFASVRHGARPEKIFLVSLLANGLVFYVFSAFSLCTAGAVAIAAVNVLLYLPALKFLYRNGREPVKKFFTPCTTFFYVASAGCFAMTSVCRFLHWDEYSHWGIAPKILFEKNLLSCAFDNILEHASYPPGLSVLEVMTQKLFFLTEFRESIVFFAVGMLMIACTVLPFAYAEKENSFFKCAFSATVCLAIPSLLLPFGFWSCEADCVLAMVFAASVFVVMKTKGKVSDDVLTSLLLAWLILIKKPGFGFAVMVLALYLIRVAVFRKDRVTKGQKFMPFFVTVFPFIVALSWQGLLKYFHTRIVFPTGKITFEGIKNLILRHEPEYAVNVAGNFVDKFTPYLLFFLALFVCVLFYALFFADKKERPCDLLWFLPVCFIFFSASLFLTYVFIFNVSQAEKLVSFSRYITSFLIMPSILLAMLIFSSAKTHKFFNNVFVGAAGSIALFFFAICPIYAYGYICHSGIDSVRRGRLQEAEDKYGKILRGKDVRFIVITKDGNGQFSFMMRYAFPDTFSEELCPVPQLPPSAEDASNLFSETELKEKFEKVSFVLFDVMPDNFPSDYGNLLVNPKEKIPSVTLCRILSDGRLEIISD